MSCWSLVSLRPSAGGGTGNGYALVPVAGREPENGLAGLREWWWNQTYDGVGGIPGRFLSCAISLGVLESIAFLIRSLGSLPFYSFERKWYLEVAKTRNI